MAVSFKLQYVYEAQLLRAASQLLRLPQAVIATALTFLHRFHKACPSGADEHEVSLQKDKFCLLWRIFLTRPAHFYVLDKR
jgi:hypothetical protein